MRVNCIRSDDFAMDADGVIIRPLDLHIPAAELGLADADGLPAWLMLALAELPPEDAPEAANIYMRAMIAMFAGQFENQCRDDWRAVVQHRLLAALDEQERRRAWITLPLGMKRHVRKVDGAALRRHA